MKYDTMHSFHALHLTDIHIYIYIEWIYAKGYVYRMCVYAKWYTYVYRIHIHTIRYMYRIKYGTNTPRTPFYKYTTIYIIKRNCVFYIFYWMKYDTIHALHARHSTNIPFDIHTYRTTSSWSWASALNPSLLFLRIRDSLHMWRIHLNASFVCTQSFMCASHVSCHTCVWVCHTCDTCVRPTYICVWDTHTYASESTDAEWMSHVTHTSESWHTCKRVMSHTFGMGWLRLVGSLKL